MPLGGGVGKIFHLGKLPVNTQLSAYYNVVHPDNGANWQIGAQVQLMFPKVSEMIALGERTGTVLEVGPLSRALHRHRQRGRVGACRWY